MKEIQNNNESTKACGKPTKYKKYKTTTQKGVDIILRATTAYEANRLISSRRRFSPILPFQAKPASHA